MTSAPPVPRRQITALILWLALTFLAPTTAVFVSVSGWYEALNKPSWSPPAWVFGPAWTVLYLMMAVAAWLVWSSGGWAAQKRPLGLYLVQLALNALWTPLFFGLHLPGLAMVEMVLLWVAVAVTVVSFWRVRRAAGLLLVPYLLWLTFAAALNYTIWSLN